jgi:hypothetical protein
MTVQEMHHAVEQGLQKVASNSFDTFLPEEIDFALNKMQERFIKQRFWALSDPKQQGLHGAQKRVDDLRILTVLDSSDDVVTPDLYADHEDFDLPTDYMFLINGRVKILYDDCQVDPELITNGDFSSATTWTLGDGTDDKWTIANGYVAHTSGSGAAFIEILHQPIRVKKGNKYLISVIVEGATGGTSASTGSFTISIGNPGTPGEGNTSFTFDYLAPPSPDNRTIYQTTHATVAKQFELHALSDNVSLQINPSQDFNGRIDNISVKRIKEIPLRIIEPDDAYNILGNPFATSTPNSAIGIVNNTEIKVFNNKSYLLKGLNVDYIRTPVEISLSSGVGCELADHTHQEIVDLTVKHLLEATESQRYQTNIAESSQTE